jgi:SAM-dependent methyltransferase
MVSRDGCPASEHPIEAGYQAHGHRLGRCPACGADDAVRFASLPDLQLVQCRLCTLVYSDPQPRAEVLDRYLEEYDIGAHFAPLGPRKRVLFQRRLARIAQPRGDQNCLCDVGCAGGQFMTLASQLGWDCTGVELNPPAAARARSTGAKIFEGALETSEELPWGTFDLVTCWDCLEHTPEPHAFAERLVRLLKPEGTLMVSTLNLRSLAFRVFGTRWSMIQQDHFTYWGAESLTKLFASLGWLATDFSTFGLGRDFVRWLDMIQRPLSLIRRRTPQAPGPATHAFAGPRTWDVRPGVLRAEHALNRLLAATSSGVDIACVVRPGPTV